MHVFLTQFPTYVQNNFRLAVWIPSVYKFETTRLVHNGRCSVTSVKTKHVKVVFWIFYIWINFPLRFGNMKPKLTELLCKSKEVIWISSKRMSCDFSCDSCNVSFSPLQFLFARWFDFEYTKLAETFNVKWVFPSGN